MNTPVTPSIPSGADLVTIAQLAGRYRTSPRTIRRLEKDGHLIAARRRPDVAFSKDALAAFEGVDPATFDPGDGPLLTPREVSARAAHSESRVKNAARRGRLAGVRVGRQWRFREADVRAWIATGART